MRIGRCGINSLPEQLDVTRECMALENVVDAQRHGERLPQVVTSECYVAPAGRAYGSQGHATETARVYFTQHVLAVCAARAALITRARGFLRRTRGGERFHRGTLDFKGKRVFDVAPERRGPTTVVEAMAAWTNGADRMARRVRNTHGRRGIWFPLEAQLQYLAKLSRLRILPEDPNERPTERKCALNAGRHASRLEDLASHQIRGEESRAALLANQGVDLAAWRLRGLMP